MERVIVQFESGFAVSNMSIKKKFYSIVKLNVLSAFSNLLGTTMIVRWLGEGVYANYVLDLATISILMIFMEAIPSSYSIFRAQDDDNHMRNVAASVAICAICLVTAIVLLDQLASVFHAFSIWMPLYALTLANKRYFDIRMQTQGRLNEYFYMEMYTSTFRLIIISVMFLLNMDAANVVWGSLAISAGVVQIISVCKNCSDYEPFKHVLNINTWHSISNEKHAYYSYYITVFLKRIRDNLMPLLAGIYFPSKETAGSFFLCYRGLNFACGQIRIIEGLLNHRPTLQVVNRMSFVKKAVVAIMAQILCLFATIVLILVSGTKSYSWGVPGLLSCIVWLNVFSTIMRADAYSKYCVAGVNAGIVAYISVMLSLVYVGVFFDYNNDLVFVGILIIAEVIALISLRLFTARVFKSKAQC